MTDTWDDDDVCKHCGEFTVTPQGKKTSTVLVVLEAPEKNDAYAIAQNKFSILKAEMSRVRLDIFSFRCMTIWQHFPNGKNECFLLGVEKVLKETRNKDAVLLVGSPVVQYFTGMGVMEVNGLKVASKYFTTPIVMACIDPTSVFAGTIGELRFALKKFAEELDG